MTTSSLVRGLSYDAEMFIPGRVAYFQQNGRNWLYLVIVTDESAYGVHFSNNERNPIAEWVTIPRHRFTDTPLTHPLTAVSWWPGIIAGFLGTRSPEGLSGAPSGTSESDVASAVAEAKREQRLADIQEFERWKANATATAHEYANNNSLCSEFDRCMEEIGLEPRSRDYEVTFTIRQTVTVNAADSDEAGDLVSGDFMAYLDRFSCDVEIDDVEAM